MALLFDLDENGKERTVWNGKLVNVPHRVHVAEDGKRVVTIDTYGPPSDEHVVVVYDEKGKVLADYKPEDLLSQQEIDFIPYTTAHQLTPHATFAFSPSEKPKQFLVTVKRSETFTAALRLLNERLPSALTDSARESTVKRIEQVQTALEGPKERVIKIDLESGKILAE